MRPSIYSWTLLNNKINVIRSPRSYSHAPPMEFLAYISEIVSRHRELIWEEKDLRNIPKIMTNVVKECIGIEGVPDLTLKIKLTKCIEKLYSEHINAWKSIILESINDTSNSKLNYDIIDPYISDFLNVNDPSFRKLSQLWVMLSYSIFIRRFRILGDKKKFPFELLVFDLADAISNQLQKTSREDDRTTRMSLEWLVLQSCCYSSIIVYPLLIWYATTFGTELPPATINAYNPSIKRIYTDFLSGMPRWAPYTRVANEKEYGYMSKDTLERYTRMLDIDSTLITMAIDLFYGRFLSNPWMRASILTSFLRTLLSLKQESNKTANIVIPAIYPRKVMHHRTEWIPTPIVADTLISGKTRDLLFDVLQRLTRQFTSEPQWYNAARLVMNILKEEAQRIESNMASRIKERTIWSIVEKSPCIKGIIIEVLHPLANYYLLDLIAKYNVAYIPGVSLGLNLIYLLMNRISGANYLNTVFYYIVDTTMLLNESLRLFERIGDDESLYQTHSVCIKENNSETCVSSYNLERLMKAILAVESENKTDFKCLKSISVLNFNILRLKRW